MRSSDWSSDVCSSDLPTDRADHALAFHARGGLDRIRPLHALGMEPLDPLHRLGHGQSQRRRDSELGQGKLALVDEQVFQVGAVEPHRQLAQGSIAARSEEQTSELQSLMRNSHAVFSLKKK